MPYRDLKKRNLSTKARRAALGNAAPPAGFAPVKVTTNGDGEVTSVQSKPKGPKDQVFDLQLQGQHVKGLSTLLDGEGNVTAQWIKTDADKAHRERLALDALDAHMKQYQGAGVNLNFPAFSKGGSEDLQVSLMLGDPHIGMLSWHIETGTDFDLTIADAYMTAAIDLLIERSPAAAFCRIVNLGDFFHANDQTGQTPRGKNSLDTDSRFAKVTRVGYGMLNRFVERARLKYPQVEVISLQGNHDPTISLALQMWLEAMYRGDSSVVIVPNESPYIYREFGENLALYHHGDGAKPDQLPGIMAAHDRGRPWGRCEHREIQGGHVHHLQRKEYPGCVFETSRTTAPADFWHHWKGYRAGRGMRSLVHHRNFGRIAEHTVGAREIELRVKASAA
jgi:hypothetical protein